MSDHKNTAVPTPHGVIIYEHLWEPDVPRTLKDGRVVGDNKYSVQIAVDPDTDEFEKFSAVLASIAGVDARVMSKLINESFPPVGDRFASLDPTHLVLKAKSKFQPPVFDRKGKQVQPGGAYSGSVIRALVKPFIYDSALARKKLLSLRLQAVLVVDPGTPAVFRSANAKALFGDLIEADSGEDVPF
jgi:hypothetical protein